MWTLLSRVELAFARDYEHGTQLSLAVMADVLRLLDRDGVRVADLPALTGVSKEAIAMAMTLLEKGHLVEVRSVQRRRVVSLTDRGANAQTRGTCERIGTVEQAWRDRFGAAAIDELRAALTPIVGDLTRDGSPLFAGTGAARRRLAGAMSARPRRCRGSRWCCTAAAGPTVHRSLNCWNVYAGRG